MLVLSRRQGESLRIGTQVRITVVAVSASQVRIAVEAPDEVPVHREEVFERIAEANREASRMTATDGPRTAAAAQVAGPEGSR